MYRRRAALSFVASVLQLANQPDCLCLCKQVLAEHRKPLHLEFHRPGVSDHSGEAGEEAAADAFPRHSSSFLCVFCFFFCLYFLPQVNLLAFGVIIYKVYRHTAVKKPQISHYENIR